MADRHDRQPRTRDRGADLDEERERVREQEQRWHDPWSHTPYAGGPIPGAMGWYPGMLGGARGYDRDTYGRGYYQRGRSGRWQDEDDRGVFDRTFDEVASWFGDDDAEQRREEDHRGRGPRGYTRSDDKIAEDVNDRLTDDCGVDASDITVSVKKGEVTLDGEVASRRQKRRAEDSADAVSGVMHTQNNLRIRRSTDAGRG